MEKKRKKKELNYDADPEYVQVFLDSSDEQERIFAFGRIQNESKKAELIRSLPETERHKFLGKIKDAKIIAQLLNEMQDPLAREKTCKYVLNQFGGNAKNFIEVLGNIDFDVTIPKDKILIYMNTMKDINCDYLSNMIEHVRNYNSLQFKINDNKKACRYKRDCRHIKYSFNEMAAITAKLEELVSGISEYETEADKFFIIYKRITDEITYDRRKLSVSDDKSQKEAKRENARKDIAGLYGGLVDHKSVCAGFSLILHEALDMVGIKSELVYGGIDIDKPHAWVQVQIDGKWYHSDPTWDAETYIANNRYRHMLNSDEEFKETHKDYLDKGKDLYHRCDSKFDFNKITSMDFADRRRLNGGDDR